MPNIIQIQADGVDDILNAGAYAAGALVRLQTSATETGTFADVSGTGSTPSIALIATIRGYTGFDPNGTSSSWYRTRYESATASRVSDWSAAFQVGDETAGLLCSIYDVEQEYGSALSANDRENVIEKIRQVTVAIEGVTGRWFAPRPLSGVATYRVGTGRGGRLRFPKGIRSLTSLGIATANQAATGGTYVVSAATTYSIGPADMDRDAGWPGTYIDIVAGYGFYSANYGAEVIGQFGWAAVPYDIQGVAARSVVRRFIGKGGGGVSVAVGPAGTEFLLPDMSGSDRATLDYYRARAF